MNPEKCTEKLNVVWARRREAQRPTTTKRLRFSISINLLMKIRSSWFFETRTRELRHQARNLWTGWCFICRKHRSRGVYKRDKAWTRKDFVRYPACEICAFPPCGKIPTGARRFPSLQMSISRMKQSQTEEIILERTKTMLENNKTQTTKFILWCLKKLLHIHK